MPTDYQRIEEAIHYLEQNFRAQPSLDELAAHLNLSPFHLQRLFRRWAGISPKRFVQFLTIEHAKTLLAETRTILDTTYEVGLSSPSRLHDLFVTIDGITPGEFKRQGAGIEITYGFHETHFGQCLLATTERGICALFFCDERHEEARLALRKKWSAATLIEQPDSTAPLVQQLFPAFSTTNPAQPAQPLRLFLKGTNFQLQVWQALLNIPPGTICSYGDIAQQIDKPRATRAVASAIAANSVAYLIPCHRVLRKSGLMGGYRWRPVRKKAMLAWEAGRREG